MFHFLSGGETGLHYVSLETFCMNKILHNTFKSNVLKRVNDWDTEYKGYPPQNIHTL